MSTMTSSRLLTHPGGIQNFLTMLVEKFHQFILGEYQETTVCPDNHGRVLQLLDEYRNFVELEEGGNWFKKPSKSELDLLQSLQVQTETWLGNKPVEVVTLVFFNRGEVKIRGAGALAGMTMPSLKVFDDRIEIRGIDEKRNMILLVLNRTSKTWEGLDA